MKVNGNLGNYGYYLFSKNRRPSFSLTSERAERASITGGTGGVFDLSGVGEEYVG